MSNVCIAINDIKHRVTREKLSLKSKIITFLLLGQRVTMKTKPIKKFQSFQN